MKKRVEILVCKQFNKRINDNKPTCRKAKKLHTARRAL